MDMSQLRDRIEREIVRVTESGCWIWLASTQKSGYGDLRVDGRHCYAHRASYAAYVGPIVDGLHVLHRCDVRSCVRPDHLFLGTNRDNVRDMDSKGRRRNGVRPTGLKYRPIPPAAFESRRAIKLDQKAELLACVERGETQRAVAEKYSVSQPTVARLIKESRQC